MKHSRRCLAELQDVSGQGPFWACSMLNACNHGSRKGCHAQEALSYLQAMGAVQKLPEDIQWSIRAMLMRR